MKVKNLLLATVFASSLTIVPTSFVKAQEITSTEENFTNYDYNDIKDFPSSLTLDLTNPDEISTQEVKNIAFGRGSTFLNRDGLEWFGTHSTSVTDGKLIFSFSVIGELFKKPKGSNSLKRLDADSDTIYAQNEGLITLQTRGKTGVVGDTMVATSHHSVNLGWSVSDAITKEEEEL